jgi:curved DNA-binding protein CbpA
MPATSDPAGYYRALGVRPTATADEIRAAFRSRAMSAHPDRAGAATGDNEAFRLIREAYEVLRDPRQRMAYDAVGMPSRSGAAAAETEAPGRPTESSRAASAEPSPEPQAASAGAEQGHRRRRSRPRGLGRGLGLAGVPDWVPRYAPFAVLGLALLLLVALGALWSANRQLADRQLLINDLYGRLALQSGTQAELNAQYRSLAFLDLERALRLGQSATGAIHADAGAAAYLHSIAFSPSSGELAPGAEDALVDALIEIARRIESLPAEADWLIVLDTQARRATFADQVAIEAWEPALLRLATALDHLLAQGLPSERLAVRFAAGFAGSSAEEAAGAGPRADATSSQVLIKLICCGP